MAVLEILHNGSAVAFYSVEKWTFNDKFMGEQYITFTAVSPVPIEWEVGDYCVFRGEEYVLRYIPSAVQKARSGVIQNGFTYENVKMESHLSELSSCMMLDVTATTGQYISSLGTNYTGSATFQLYCGETVVNGSTRPPVCVLAAKMQANLDRLYPSNGWQILVDTTSTWTDSAGNTVLVTHTDDKTLTFNNDTVAKALKDVHDIFDLSYSVKGRVIKIGYSLKNLTSDDDSATFAFGYGKGYPTHESGGKSLFQIKRIANQNQLIVTRLRAMGSTKNLPYRYYFKKYASDNTELTQALIVNNLQLPGTFLPEGNTSDTGTTTKWGLNNSRVSSLRKVKGDTNDAYIDKNDDAENTAEGIHEYSAKWDGSDSNLEEIYPTIEDVTYSELRNAGIQDQQGNTGQSAFPNYQGSEKINELLAIGYLDNGSLVDDANVGDGFLPESSDSGVGKSFSSYLANATASFNSSNYGDFTHNSGYFSLTEIELFTVQGVTKGEYYLTPTESSVFFRFSVSSSNTTQKLSVGFIISIYQQSHMTGSTALRARYISDYTEILPADGTIEVVMPRIPDVENVGNAHVSDNIAVSDLSDVVVKFTPIIRDNITSSYSATLTYGIGNSTAPNASTAEPQYTWVETDDSKGLGTFHVFIKDMGFELSAQLNGETPVVAMKNGACVGREFEIGANIEKVTYNNKKGYMLTLNRAQDTNLGTYYPSEVNQLAAGDKFVLLNIDLPDVYIEAAEVRLLAAATDYLADNDETKYTYQPYLDDIYLQRNIDAMALANTPELSVFYRLYAGLKLTFRGIPTDNDDLTPLPLIELTIDSVKIDMGQKITPQVELVLNDDVEQTTIQKLTTAVDRIYNGSLFGSKSSSSGGVSTAMLLSLIQSEGGKLFLSKRSDDTAVGDLTFEGNSTFNGDIEANGESVFNGDVEIGDAQGSDNPTLTAHGDTEFNGNNVFNGRVTVDNTLDAQGDTELTGALETRQGTIEGYARLITRMLLGNYNGDFDNLNADGGFLDKDGNAELENLLVRSMAKITETVFRDMTSAKPSVQNSLSAFFEDGFGGHGMRMWHDDTKGWCMTLDTLRVRQTMYIYELVIQKIRAVGGILLVSAADGKIDTVQTVYVGTNNVPHYLITFEDRNMFEEHDLMRCQKWSGKNYLGGDVDFDETHYDPSTSVHDTSETMKYYWVEVDYTMTSNNIPSIVTADDVGVTLGEKDILVRCDRFDDTLADPDTGEVYSVGVEPASGDECVLMGNTTDTARQNYIMISAAEDGVPRIDIKTGCNAVGNTGNLRTRVGCLDGIFDSYWPIDGQPNGYGLYSDNAWLKGKFVVKINNQDKDVGTQFEVIDGMIRSTVEATRQDLIGEEGHISNNMFFNRYDKWWLYDGGEIYVLSSDGTETTFNDSTGMLVSTGGAEYARLVEDDTVGHCDVLEIKAASYSTSKGLVQKNADFRNLPIFETDETTQEIVKQNFMLTFYYYALTSSTVYTDLNGDVETTSLSATTDNRYHKVSIPYKWDGEGDFAIYGFGHFRIYGIVLTGNVDESMLDHYVTQIQQTAQSIELKATAYIDIDGVMTPVLFSDFYQDYNGFVTTVNNRFTQTNSTINQTADNITMSVTEKIADSGNKYLNNASFNGWDKWTRNNTTAITSEVLNGRVILDMSAAQGQALTITQANADFKDKPTLFNDGNTPQPYPVVAEFYLEMVTSAIVLVSLGGVNMGTISTDETGRGFLRYKFSKGWDATGDFVITVRNGHVRIHSLMLNADTDAVARSMISISSTQILAQVETEYVPVEGFGNRVKGVSGLVISGENGNFATLFAEAVADEDYNIAKVSTSVQYDQTTHRITSNVLISADKINLEGYTTINDGFSVDEKGNAKMNNATIAGVLNNLIQTKIFFASDNHRWDFNPLEWGSVIEWTPYGTTDTHELYLPTAQIGANNRTYITADGLTMMDLRQCVGKKYTFLCTANTDDIKMDVVGELLIYRQEYITIYNGSTLLDFDLNTMTANSAYTPSQQYTKMTRIQTDGDKYFTAECKTGKFNGSECIYWEIYCSAKRSELSYTVQNPTVNNEKVPVTINGNIAKGAVIEFESTSRGIFRTTTDNHGNYAIALFSDTYEIRVYEDNTTTSYVYREQGYIVSDNQTKGFTITT